MELPLVSVIIPSFNHGKYVEAAVRSVWSQDYPAVELIVIDDGSTDGSAEILRALEKKAPIPMRTVSRCNRGVSITLNEGLLLASGRWIALLSSDDFFLPTKLSTQIAKASSLGPEYGCIHSDALIVDGRGAVSGRTYERSVEAPMENDAFVALALGEARVIATSVMVRRDLVDAVGGFDESMVAEDFDFHLRLAKLTKYGFIAEPLLAARALPRSLGRSPHKWIDDSLRALAKHREHLDSMYETAVRRRALRNVFICSRALYSEGMWRYAAMALDSSRGFRENIMAPIEVGREIVGGAVSRLAARVRA